MKIIDTHTHFPGHAFGLKPKTGAQVREEFEAEGFSGAWIFTTDGLLSDPARHNDLLHEGVRNDLDFFTPFCTVNPHDGAARAVKELERCAGSLRMKGLKFHSWLQAFSLTNPAVEPIMRRAGELGLPVLLHDGTPPYSTPLQIASVAEKVPGTTVILGHSGLDDLWEDAILAANRHRNIFLCLCSLSAGAIREIIRRVPPERLLYGSDSGLGPGLGQAAIAKIRGAKASARAMRLIFSENAMRLMERKQGVVR